MTPTTRRVVRGGVLRRTAAEVAGDADLPLPGGTGEILARHAGGRPAPSPARLDTLTNAARGDLTDHVQRASLRGPPRTAPRAF